MEGGRGCRAREAVVHGSCLAFTSSALHLLTLNASADVCFFAGDSEGLADRQQHWHHERRLEGLLVCPHGRKLVLV